MSPHRSTQDAGPSTDEIADSLVWIGFRAFTPNAPRPKPTGDNGGPDTQLLESRLKTFEHLIRSSEGSWPVYAMRELLHKESTEEVVQLSPMKDDSKFKLADWINLAYVLQSYLLMSIYSPRPTHPSPRCKQKMPAPLPAVYDLKYLGNIRLMLLKLRSNLAVFRNLFDNNQLGMKKLTSMGGLKTMRTLSVITETASILENIYLASFCMLFIFEGAVNVKQAPLEIPGVPPNLDEIVVLVKRVYGELDLEDVAFIRTTFKTYGVHGLQLALLTAVLISPLLLLQGFKIAAKGTSKLTILQIAFCLGNQKPPLLQEIEGRFWKLLQRVSRDNVSLFPSVFDFFDNLPWEEIEALSPEENSFFVLDAANPDTTLEGIEDEVTEQTPSKPPAQFAGSSSVNQDQQAVPTTTGTVSTKRTIPDSRSPSPTPAKKKKRRTKRKPTEPEVNDSDQTVCSTSPNSNHTLPHEGGEQLRRSQRFRGQDVDMQSVVVPAEDETPIEQSPAQTRLVDTKPRPIPTGMTLPVPPALGGSSQRPIIVESLYEFKPTPAPSSIDSPEIKENQGYLPAHTSNGMFVAFSLRCHNHDDLDQLTRVNETVQDLWDQDTPLFLTNSNRSIFSHICVKTLSYPESLEDARQFRDQLSLKHLIISQPGHLEGSLSYDFRTVLATKVEPYGNIIEIHDQSISRDRNDSSRIQYGTIDVLLNSLTSGPNGRILSTYPIPSTRHEVSVPVLCTATVAYDSTRNRGPCYRGSEASPDDLCHWRSMLSGALHDWEMPPDGLSVAITIEAGELYVVICSSTVEQLAYPVRFLELEPSKPYILEGGYEAVLLSGTQTIFIHPGSMYLLYAPLDVVFHQRHFYFLPTIQKSQLALTHSFVQGKRLSMDIATLDVSRKLLCRMMVFWHDCLVLGKRHTNDTSKLHLPTFESFKSTVEFFSVICLCILSNAYDPRSFQWINKDSNVNRLSQDDRIRTYELVETATGMVVDGTALFWIPSLAIQASGLYQYKLLADRKTPVFATSCTVADLKEELTSCLELFQDGKKTFDSFVAQPLKESNFPLGWNLPHIYTVRKKKSPISGTDEDAFRMGCTSSDHRYFNYLRSLGIKVESV